MCGLKSFFQKIGQGLKKVGRFVKDKALPAIGRIAKPIFNIMGMIPGKIGAIGQVGSAVTSVLHGITEKIPNKDVREKIDNVINKGNDKFQTVIDKGKQYAETGNQIVGAVKDGFNNTIKPAVMPKVLKPL